MRKTKVKRHVRRTKKKIVPVRQHKRRVKKNRGARRVYDVEGTKAVEERKKVIERLERRWKSNRDDKNEED